MATRPAAAKVTPSVLASTYSIGGVNVSRGATNRQAVFEAQGQYMSSSDLRRFFSRYVPLAQAGDDAVAKFVGVHKERPRGIEAELDVQYIMGDAPGVRTEFWEYASLDFCGDLYAWTEAILSEAHPPLVHSVSYGWQGPLGALRCANGQPEAIDDNLAKLAARGITVVVSSGDEGAGYIDTHQIYSCDASIPGEVGVGVSGGTVTHTSRQPSSQECCNAIYEGGISSTPSAWSFESPRPLGPFSNSTDYAFNASRGTDACHSIEDARHRLFHRPIFRKGDVYHLSGHVGATGGAVTVHCDNHTFADAMLTFGPPTRHITPSPFGPAALSIRRAVNGSFGASGGMDAARADGAAAAAPTTTRLFGHADFHNVSGGPHPGSFEMTSLSWYSDAAMSQLVGTWWPGDLSPTRAPFGTCTYYRGGTRTPAANATTTVSAFLPPREPARLWPSWPASSPWVTAVGATTFAGAKVGAPEVATTQFGSGGGFSREWDRTHATWQEAAVSSYLHAPGVAPPPSGMFPAHGRATPDVSALGEGYQVVDGRKIQSIGGTSASAPLVASMISLLNEARLQAGKPPMGFVNPFLYRCASKGCFTDVTVGTNAIDRTGAPLKAGWNATKGWDPVTGLGSPRFDKLLEAALAL